MTPSASAALAPAPLTLVLGAGLSGMASADFLQRHGMPFALIEPDGARLRAVRQAAGSAGLQPDCILSRTEEVEPLLARAGSLICSPGIPPGHQMVRRARRFGVPVTSDLDLFRSLARAPLAVITGTNGKSTVTTLLGQMAERDGRDVGVGGNLGPPALSLLRDGRDLYVLEVSSFQLEYSSPLAAEVAVMLNLHFDHLDRHGNLRRYAEIKRQIFAGAKRAIYNRSDRMTLPPLWEKAQRVSFGLDAPPEGCYGVRDGSLCRGEELLMPTRDIGWRGPGRVQNALAALAAGDCLGLGMDAMLQAIGAFRGLPHRCRTVLEHRRVRWIDDSKATNPAAAAASIQAVSGGTPSVVLIAGGDSKNAELSILARAAADNVRAAVLIGRDAERLGRALRGLCALHFCDGLPAAVRKAASVAKPGTTVLLAPGCASQDEFIDYRERGQVFADCARELAS